jgi:hypothetical protein
MKESVFIKTLQNKVRQLRDECGDAFLELMIDTIELKDAQQREITTLYGFEYNLACSRHWDKEQNIHIFYDGFTDKHLSTLYRDICRSETRPAHIHISFDGMNDLDEAIHGNIDLEFDEFHE